MKYFDILVGVALLLSCTQEPKDVIVKVDGSSLTKTELQMYVSEENYKQLPEERIKELEEGKGEEKEE